MEDLGEFIEECNESNNQIILMMDCNENMENPGFKAWLESLGLTDIIPATHGGSAPPTYHRGSKQIDGIFVSRTIHPIHSGFLPFGEFPPDHRVLWINMTFENAFGFKM